MYGYFLTKMLGVFEEAKAREEWICTLPEDEANKIRADDELKYREYKLHLRALEIAEASRPRNFWGK